MKIIKLKKSQMKMLESIFVLIIFFFMLIFGIIFYTNYKIQNSKDRDYESSEIRLIEISNRLQNLPEIQCTIDGVYVEFDCIDLHKFESFVDYSKDNVGYYSKLLYNSFINVTQTYPTTFNHQIYSSGETDNFNIVRLPVNIYNASSKMNNFGYITIGVYR